MLFCKNIFNCICKHILQINLMLCLFFILHLLILYIMLVYEKIAKIKVKNEKNFKKL